MTEQVGNQLGIGDDGVLRPITTTPKELLTEEELALHRCVNSGGSGRGGSFWASASRCGRRALLAEKKYAHFRDIQSTLPLIKNHFLVGSLYHYMQEQWRVPRSSFPDLSFSAEWVNVNVQEAARLFTGYRNNWDRHLWGDTLAIEALLPGESPAAEAIKDLYDAELTGKVDLVVDLQEKHLDKARMRLPELTAGRYIVDFKTAEMPGNGMGYTHGLQALVYPLLWNMAYPDQPVQGTIFDVIYKRSRRRPVPLTVDDFGAYFAPFEACQADAYASELKGMILQGKYTTDNDIPNRSECCSWRGELCQFYQKECNVEV